ncbi:Ferroporti-1 [Rhexocercosporidium sp. MPI-PUGE-AT-0058]|nr:Ferroporti-1 [Rhexocercosporidium sp. MPI-PUGE-AT-0058]
MSASLDGQARQRQDSHPSRGARNSFNDRDNDNQELLHGLLSDEAFESDGEHVFSLVVERTKWWKIYMLHFLFMWNTRTFEYVSIILVASAFPEDLTAMSIRQVNSVGFEITCLHICRGMASTLSTILFASSVGSWIDKSPNSTAPLGTSIVVNHASIVIIYLAWMLWPGIVQDDSTFTKNALFTTIVLFDVVQVMSAVGNSLSISRDWIPTLVGADMGSDYTLSHVNAVIARVNLFCKVASPLLLPVIISAFSRSVWISLVILTTVLVWIVEIYVLRNVSLENPQLLSLKAQETNPEDSMEGLGLNGGKHMDTLRKLEILVCRQPAQRLRHFFSMPIWPAAICMAFLYLTVLVYSAPLITYLLQSGMPLTIVTIARASGSLLGFIATFTTPLASEYLSRRFADRKAGKGIVPRMLSSWGIIGQFLSLIPVVLVLRSLSPSSPDGTDATTEAVSQAGFITIFALFGFLSLSRLFHWTYELMEQELEQSEVPASQRSTFSGTGQAICSCFDLLHWLAIVAWERPEQFKGLAVASLCVVGSSAVWFWVWARRS